MAKYPNTLYWLGKSCLHTVTLFGLIPPTYLISGFSLTDRLWLEGASFGRDRISAEVEFSQFTQGF